MGAGAATCGSPVSHKRPLGPGPAASLAAVRSGGGVGGSASPRAKRRLFATGPGRRSTVSAAAEVERSLRRRGLIIHAGALTVAAAVCCIAVMRMRRARGRKCSAQELAPLREALAGLASAIRAAAAPVEPHPDLYPTVMGVPGFTREQLLAALFYLAERRARGSMFLVMSEPHRALWIKQILGKQEL